MSKVYLGHTLFLPTEAQLCVSPKSARVSSEGLSSRPGLEQVNMAPRVYQAQGEASAEEAGGSEQTGARGTAPCGAGDGVERGPPREGASNYSLVFIRTQTLPLT